VPDLEQGTEDDTMETDGEVVVDDTHDDTITGVLDGRGEVSLKSHFSQELIGVTVEVVALAFVEIDLLDDYGGTP